MKRLEGLKKKYSFIQEVRGKGLMIGMEFTREAKSAVNECLKKGFLINCTSDTVMRFVPPLVVTTEEIDLLVQVWDEIFSTWS